MLTPQVPHVNVHGFAGLGRVSSYYIRSTEHQLVHTCDNTILCFIGIICPIMNSPSHSGSVNNVYINGHTQMSHSSAHANKTQGICLDKFLWHNLTVSELAYTPPPQL